jgi:aryl-alcohol dehydrogenase-like predicted oxidoreductase
MQQRRLGEFNVSALGLGCMNLSHAYGTPPPPEQAGKLLLRALDHGITFFDTAALYGFGNNETLLGNVLKPHRSKIVLASKCGMTGVDGKRVIDGRPATLKRTCDESLRRLQTDVIDLYYLHRWDKQVPIEDSVGALADLVQAGKIRAIGLSEVSAPTLRRAQAVHPIAALQSEYSLWTRNAELGTLASLPRTWRRLRCLQPAGARLPHRHAARPRNATGGQGHPPPDAALRRGQLRPQP